MDQHTKHLSQLRDLLDRHFILDEIMILCFDLGVDYDNLPGKTKLVKIQGLVKHFDQRVKLDELIDLAQAKRPKVEWPRPPVSTDQGKAELVDPRLLITQDQAREIARLIGTLAKALTNFYETSQYGLVYGALYSKYDIHSYKFLPADRFAEAKNWLITCNREIETKDNYSYVQRVLWDLADRQRGDEPPDSVESSPDST